MLRVDPFGQDQDQNADHTAGFPRIDFEGVVGIVDVLSGETEVIVTQLHLVGGTGFGIDFGLAIFRLWCGRNLQRIGQVRLEPTHELARVGRALTTKLPIVA